MEMDVPRQLENLRLQNQTLLDQLRTRQSTMKSLLNTFSGSGNLDTSVPTVRHANPEVQVTTSDPVSFPTLEKPAQPVTNVHLHSAGTSVSRTDNLCDPDLSVNELSTIETKSQSQREPIDPTLQSILKRRKIIDDNVKVGNGSTVSTASLGSGLNFDYSEEEDTDMLKKVIRNQLEIDMALERDTAGRENKEVEELLRTRQLNADGNDRQHSAIIRELSTRPKSVIFDENVPQARETFGTTNTSAGISALTTQRSGEHPLLGYDFIAGLLDNESVLVDKSDVFYEELNEFRRVNKDECTGNSRIETVLDLTRPISPEIKDPGHTCVHGYNVNDRLYPEPLNEDPDGRSMCPVCLSSRREPTDETPGYVRVSIPRSTLQAPYKVKPHRRRSFDDTDNFALSKHCLAGWECSKPSMLPTASTVDLKQASDGLRAKLTTTLQDIEAITASYKRVNRPDTLLDTSRALRAEVQFNAMNRTVSNYPLHSTVR